MIPGVKVGHHTLAERPTGCTVILVEAGAVSSSRSTPSSGYTGSCCQAGAPLGWMQPLE
jgi:L-aminopeptidase/D-esterase-like protein